MSRQRFQDRWRVRRQGVKVAETTSGTIRAAFVTADRAGAYMFSRRERRQMMQVALSDGAKSFMLNAWPLRFTPYAYKKLRYSHPPKTNARNLAPANFQPSTIGMTLKRGYPLVDTGLLGSRSIEGSRAKAILGSNPRVKMRFPQPHALKAKDKAVLQRITRAEVAGVAKRVERTMLQLIASGRVTKRSKDGRQPLRRSLSGARSIIPE